jgi:hypothetical protein
VFADPARAALWLAEARGTLRWLVESRLVNMAAGAVADRLNASCDRRVGRAMTYTEGEVAEALTQLGVALHDRSYLERAARFLRYTTTPSSGLVRGGVLQERCEGLGLMCERVRDPLNLPAYKGIFVQAVSDWSAASRSPEFSRFLVVQASAILSDSISDGAHHPGDCRTPHTCQFGFHWASPTVSFPSKIGVTVGTQMSALDALTAVLPMRSLTPSR